jgi:SAM-dependent methyltransferase
MDITRFSDSLERNTEGVWHALSKETVSYPEHGNRDCFLIEDESFWFQHRNRCIEALLSRFNPPTPLFDIGGGNGCVAKFLQNSGYDIVLVEPGKSGIANAAKRGVTNLVCGTTKTANFKKGSLPSIGLFDVIEHIPDDLDFMRHIQELLHKEGRVFATVPAYQFLWSNEDKEAGHFRRYNKSKLCSLFDRAGFNVDYITYFFRWLPIPICLMRTIPSRLKLPSRKNTEEKINEDHATSRSTAKNSLDWMLLGEARKIGELKSLGFGGSILLTASPKK